MKRARISRGPQKGRVHAFACVCAAILTSFAARAHACPSCFSSSNENVLQAYYFTAAMMTVLPLLIVGSMVAWLYTRFRNTKGVRDGDQPSLDERMTPQRVGGEE